MSSAFWSDAGSGTVAGLAVLIVAGLVTWTWRSRGRAVDWWRARWSRASMALELSEDARLEVLREQVLERARLLGKRMPVSQVGNRVTWSDGKTVTYIPDYQMWRSALGSGRGDLHATENRKPPTPLAWWPREQMEVWLSEHPLP